MLRELRDHNTAVGRDAAAYDVGTLVAAKGRPELPMTVMAVAGTLYTVRYGSEAGAWRGKTADFEESALVSFGSSVGPRRRQAPRHFDEAPRHFDEAPASAPSPRVFDRGTVVEARWQGGTDWSDWYPGKITARRDDATYDVAYDDGDVEYGVAVALIRPPQTARESAEVGQELQVRFHGSGEHRGVVTSIGQTIEVTWRPVIPKPGEIDTPEVTCAV